MLAVEGWPDERVVKEVRGEHERAIAHLDSILALDAEDLPVLLWRACLRLDLDDRNGAANDLRRIAEQGDSAYFRELARRYANSDPQQLGARAIDLTDLPAPTSAAECYVAGFHELRNRHVRGSSARADELLERASDRYLPARDLRLLSMASLAEKTRDDDARLQLLTRLYDEAVKLEAIYGGQTARTQAMRGVALLMMRRYDECIAPLARSIELRPQRHGPHQNLAVALRRLGRLDDAEHHLRQALLVRPFAWNSRYTLAQVLRDRGQYAAAYAIMDDLATTGQRGEAWKHPRGVGQIAMAETMSLWKSDREAAKAAAARSAASYRAELAVRDSASTRQQLEVAEALSGGDKVDALIPLAKAMLRNPENPYQLGNMAFVVPRTGLNAEQTAWLTAVLRRIAIAGAGGDEGLKARLRGEIDASLREFR